MDIHKPKPWHGPREFAKEYAIIVIGVLTALAAEQTVEWLHRHAELAETREAIRTEVTNNATIAQVTILENTCLIGLGERISAWAKGGPAPRPAAIVSPFFSTTVWDSSQAGAVSRMPLKEKFAYGRFYESLRNEQSLAAGLRAQAQGIGRYFALDRLTEAEARSLLQDQFITRASLNIMIENAKDLLQQAHDLGLRAQPIKPITRQMLAAECRLSGLPTPDFDTPVK